MLNIVIAMTLAAAGERLPPTPDAFWIWPTLEEAKAWSAEHRQRLCIRRVPDGFATYGCGRVSR